MTTPSNTRWKIIDRETGAEGEAIEWRFRVGDQVKVRVLNEMAGDHPMRLLLDVSEPGRWMAHCHIAEHHESGMMFQLRLEP